MRRLLLSTLLVLLAAAPALADVVTLKDGSKREGRIVRQNDDEVVLEVALGSLKAELILKRSEIRSIEKGATANEKLLAEVERRRRRLRPNDAAGWLAYARWLDGVSGFSKEARAAFEKVIAVDPNNEAARRRLGYRKVGGQWMTEEELMLAKGYVRHGGRWVSPEQKAAEADGKKLENIKIALAEEVREEQARKDAEAREKWLAEMQKLAEEKAARYTAQAEAARSGVILGPTSGNYYGVYSGGGPVYYYRPYVIVPGGTTQPQYVPRPYYYGWGFRYKDDHWSIGFGSGGTVIRYRK
ncbi:MAG: hypothetical protein ACYTGB_06365 [Planctomycetota bacterium]|jgi:hypothetical protein